MSRKKLYYIFTTFALVLITLGGVGQVAASNSAAPVTAVSQQTDSPDGGKTVHLDGNKSVDGVACSQIYTLGINKQANIRAAKIMNECGLGGPEPASGISAARISSVSSVRPSDFGGSDVNTISGTDTYPKVTQSESFVWGNGNTVIVNMNDSKASPGCYAGLSYSTDGGSTFTRLSPSPLCTGHGTNYGDPTVVWDANLNLWYASDLATGCGGQGIGLWTSPDGITWTAGSCAHSGTSDDRQSMWVDNNPSSAYYGRMYISWNDFAAGQGLFVTHSDNGTTWTSATVFSTFRRDVEITGSPGADGTVILASMDEGSGGLGNRTNYIYKSVNGGTTWTNNTTGPAFPGPGDGVCSSNSYFAKINPIWRHMGWGQPAVGPANTVHYVYAQHGAGADGGDIYYVRSTDNGATWSAPLKLNTDGTTKAQWMPSLSASAAGGVVAGWYDRRDDSANNNSYKYYGRVSVDGGATWQADAPVSDVLSPQPLQPDSGVQSCYVGDYNYHSFVGNTALMTWTDGRNLMSGNSQQDVYFDKVPAGGGTPTPTVTGTPPTATQTPTRTSTPTATPTPCGGQANWTAGANLPAPRVRALGLIWPGNGKLYLLGGRNSDAAGSDVLNPTEYDPATNTWTTKSATFPTNFVNNMAGGVITISGTQQIIAVGGSFATGTTASHDVRLYNPGTDTLITLGSDPWPGAGGANDTLPGGYAVWNNKLYILGGFQINVQMVNTIYEFDPARPAGSRWQLKTATLPVQLGYLPTAAIGNFIYTAGGSIWDGTTLQDDADSYKYDPTADTITTIPSIPRATAETRALNYGGKMWVLGGGRVAPNPSNEVDIYDPVANSWTTGLSFTNARRNDSADTDGTKIYLAGGYAPTTATDSLEIYTPGTSCASPTPAPPTATSTPVPPTATMTSVPPTATSTSVPATATATGVPATNTPPAPTVTATNCPNPFVDINGNVFYNAIMYLYCRGIVNGVDATHYGPAGTASRAQFAKVVVLGFAIPSYTPATPTFTDVPITYFAYQYIEAGYHAGILSGYDAATCAAIGAAFPCYGPNRPITRAQLTKLVVVAGNCPLFTPTSGQTFSDVGPSNIFFAYIESAHNAGVINGYPDNTFRPNNNIRRDEMAQIVYKAILNCPGQGSITPTAVAPTNTVVAPTSTPGMANVSITNFAFTPQTITVTVGTTVMWQNNGSAHTVTSDTLGQFDSGNIPAGGSYSHQFTTAGSYAYHCEYHSGMTGTVIVTP